MEPTVSFFAGTENTGKRQKKESRDSVQYQEIEEVHTFKKCRFCSGSHTEVSCPELTSTEQRLAEVRRQRLCYNCLGRHQVARCYSKLRCRQCRRKHHTSICDHSTSSLNPEATPFLTKDAEPDVAILHSTEPQKSTVFLKTAVAPIASKDLCRETNILFDEGATRSFITQELADALQLPQDKSEEVQLASFGGHVEEIRQSKSSTVFIFTDDGRRLPIDVLIVPRISTPLTSKLQHVTSLEYLRGLKLAHPIMADGQFDIELLIGADSYWNIVEDQTVRGDGPTAVKSKVGYLLSGPLKLPIAEPAREHMMTLIMSSPKTKPVQRIPVQQHNAKKSLHRRDELTKEIRHRKTKRRAKRRGRGRVQRRAAATITEGRSATATITKGRVGGRTTTTSCDADLVTANDEVQPTLNSWRRPWRRPWRRRPRSLREKPLTPGHDNATHPGSRDPDSRRQGTRGTFYPRRANTRCRSTRMMTGGDDHLAGRRMSWTAGRRADRGDVTHTKPQATST